MKKLIGIYALKNINTNKMYIGQSINISGRIKQHFSELRRGFHHSLPLQNSFNKHGESAFIFGVIEECIREELNEKEAYWIDYYDTYNNGYNAAIQDGKTGGRIYTDKDREVQSRILKLAHSKIPEYKKKERIAKMMATKALLPPPEAINLNIKLYNPEYELQHEFKNSIDCCRFLDITLKRLNKERTSVKACEKHLYKGFVMTWKNYSLDQYISDRKILEERRDIAKKERINKPTISNRKSIEERNKSWKINAIKAAKSSVENRRNSGKHAILVHTKDGKFIGKFGLHKDAAEYLNINPCKIYRVLSGEKKSYRGCVFTKA